MTRVVIGLPAFAGGKDLTRVLTELLGQTYAEVHIMVVDDGGSEDTAARLRTLSDNPRVSFVQNPQRVGMVANWNATLRIAGERYPDAEYFAWASDHDSWELEWLRHLVAELDARPEAVAAYPLSDRCKPGETVRSNQWEFETQGVRDPRTRLAQAARHMVAGDMIYGLFRRHVLDGIGGFPTTIYPDRLLLARLALVGEFVQVPVLLWHRRVDALSTPRRQRRTLFVSPPAHAFLPWWLVHGWQLRRVAGPGSSVRYAVSGAVVALKTLPFRAKLTWRERRRKQ